MSEQRDGKSAAVSEAYRYRIVPMGNGPVGWTIERDGKIWRTGPRLEVLGAWLDAFLAGASSYDADDIQGDRAERRPHPSYDERKAVFNATGSMTFLLAGLVRCPDRKAQSAIAGR
jgi:hypothetical protein